MTVSDWERGEYSPGADNLRAIADLAEMSVDELTGEVAEAGERAEDYTSIDYLVRSLTARSAGRWA